MDLSSFPYAKRYVCRLLILKLPGNGIKERFTLERVMKADSVVVSDYLANENNRMPLLVLIVTFCYMSLVSRQIIGSIFFLPPKKTLSSIRYF